MYLSLFLMNLDQLSKGINIKYSVHNYAMSSDAKNFSNQQKIIWLPFFKNLLIEDYFKIKQSNFQKLMILLLEKYLILVLDIVTKEEMNMECNDCRWIPNSR